MNKIRISNYQVIIAIFATTIAYGHFVYTGLVFRAAGRDAWFCLAVGILIGSGVLYMQMKLATWFQRASLVQYTRVVFGKSVGGFISLFYIAFFCLASSLTIQELSIFMGIIYPQTPPQFFMVFEFLLVVWVVRAGGETVTRVIQLIFPFLVFLGLLAALFAMKDKDPSRLLPFLDHSLMGIMHGTLIYVVILCDLIVFANFYSDVTDMNKLLKTGWKLHILAFILFVGPATGPIMIFGQKLASALPYPTFAEIKYIQITGIFERMDIVAVMLWTIGAYIRASVYALGATRAVAHFFNEQRETLYTMPVVLVIAGISLSLMPMSREEIHDFLFTTYPFIALLVGAVFPLLTIVVVLIRNRKQLTAKAAQASSP